MTTRLVNDRQKGLLLGYQATDWNHQMSYDDYENGLKDWIIRVIERDNQPIGAVFTKDDELHVSVLPSYRGKWLTKSLMRELFEGKRVTTRVSKGHDRMYGILHRLGFSGTDLLVKG